MRGYQTAVFLFAFFLVSILAEEPCLSYVDTMTPILRSGDIHKLREAFKKINSDAPSSYEPPIDNTVVEDKQNINMLVSLSKPFISLMNATEMWPRNSRAYGADFTRLNTHHGGVRFIYGCLIHQERSCLRNKCRYNPNVSMGIARGRRGAKSIFITIDNFIAANGSAIADYIEEEADSFVISGFNKITVLECTSSQLFVKYGDDDCFGKAKFLTLQENIEMYREVSGTMVFRDGTSLFALMS